ncbi:cytochrome P450 [Schizopora paradoxa]|uniref:Cytochrome P450 n=1 Tax=Schizopora paradoxa TaxID=27342 RepID=A0A0H2RHW5_9AGAM|nr:cytochrome P450 [Schizopora paradoxa]
MGELFDRRNGPQFHADLIRKYDRIAKVYGFLGDEQLYVSDPLALQSIIVKDQDAYEETRVFIDNNKIIFGEGLVATIGEHHKRQRKLVTPAFSVQRLRRLVPTFYDVANRLRTALLDTVEKSPKSSSSNTTVADMAEWMSRAAIESIGCAGLGYSLDPLDSPATNPYTKTVRELIPALFSIALLRLLTPFVLKLGPPAFRRFILDWMVPVKAVQKVKHMADVMDRTCREVLERKRVGRDVGVDDADTDEEKLGGEVRVDGDGKDIMSILLDSNDVAKDSEKLSDAELLGQMNVLIFGAQDTTSSALSRILQILSKPENAKLQNALREEIELALEEKNDDELGYEDVMDRLPLLDAVMKETLRLHPPVPFVRRVTTRDTTLPLTRPIRLTDGTYTSVLSVPKGTTIWISIAGANICEDVWGPGAERWDYTRWLDVNSADRERKREREREGHSEITALRQRQEGDLEGPKIVITDEQGRTVIKEREKEIAGGVDGDGGERLGAERGEVGKRSKSSNLAGNQVARGRARLPGIFAGMLTFFGGGRSCVGYRFAILEMKIIMSTLLTSFTFSESPENEVVWRLSQILSPSYIPRQSSTPKGLENRGEGEGEEAERLGLPIRVSAVRCDRSKQETLIRGTSQTLRLQ